jgi:hypothetical protein
MCLSEVYTKKFLNFLILLINIKMLKKDVIISVIILCLVISISFNVVLGLKLKQAQNSQSPSPSPSASPSPSLSPSTSTPGLPKKFLYNNDPNTIDIATLSQSSNYKQEKDGSRDYVISDNPIYLANGLKIHLDEALVSVHNHAITSAINDMASDDVNHIEITTLDGLVTNLKQINTNTSNVQSSRESIDHYIELITNFLGSNPDADTNWKATLKLLGDVRQIIDIKDWQQLPKEVKPLLDDIETQANNLTVPSMDDIYDYLKFTITKLGGMSAILHRFQHRIKWDMIQSIANNDPNYRVVPSKTTPVPSGKCTFYPLSWWQNCPEDTIPVGSRGYNKNPAQSACHKWYERLSGELLCGKVENQYEHPINGKHCKSIIEAGEALSNPDVQKILSVSLSTILSTLSLIPQLSATIKSITAIFKLAMPYVKGDYTWLLDDLKDVCFNYICPETTDDDIKANKVCGRSGKNGGPGYCVPKFSDKKLANRDCLTDKLICNTQPSGVCTNDATTKPTDTSTTLSINNNESPFILQDYSKFI